MQRWKPQPEDPPHRKDVSPLAEGLISTVTEFRLALQQGDVRLA